MDIIEETQKVQNQLEHKATGISRGKLARVLKMSRKPDMEEYKKTLLITFAGVIAIGGLGFLIYLGFTYIPPWVKDVFNI